MRKTIRLCTMGDGKRLHEVAMPHGKLTGYYWSACVVHITPEEYRRSKLYGLADMTWAFRRRLCKHCVRARERGSK